jgi:hypothetical protein
VVLPFVSRLAGQPTSLGPAVAGTSFRLLLALARYTTCSDMTGRHGSLGASGAWRAVMLISANLAPLAPGSERRIDRNRPQPPLIGAILGTRAQNGETNRGRFKPISPISANRRVPICRGFAKKRLKGFEPSTFCMATRPASARIRANTPRFARAGPAVGLRELCFHPPPVVAIVDLPGGESRGAGLDDFAHGEQLRDVITCHLPHDGAAVGNRRDQTLRLEPADRLAHGPAADAELARQLGLDEAVPGREAPDPDRLANLVDEA